MVEDKRRERRKGFKEGTRGRMRSQKVQRTEVEEKRESKNEEVEGRRHKCEGEGQIKRKDHESERQDTEFRGEGKATRKESEREKEKPKGQSTAKGQKRLNASLFIRSANVSKQRVWLVPGRATGEL